jgi:glycosyltransferase involved in cell wall biosynthesis
MALRRVTVNKIPGRAIYSSAYYRGLECLLNMWPEIKKAVPGATLEIFYGWQSWIAFQGEDAMYHRIVKLLEDLKDQGVTEHGRVSHLQLQEEMEKSSVWLYPTEFQEIHCITALKQNLAGNKIVCTDVAALKETAGPNATFIETDRLYSDGYSQGKFVKAAIDALKTSLTEEQIKTQQDWAKKFTWNNVAKQWAEVIDEA